MICKQHTKFKVGEILLINFNEIPSIFKVLRVDRSKNVLDVQVIADYYKTPIKKDKIINIGMEIFEQYWFFERGTAKLAKLHEILYE